MGMHKTTKVGYIENGSENMEITKNFRKIPGNHIFLLTIFGN